MMTFGTSVTINNLLALRAFHTFLFNYSLHERPTWFENKVIPYLRKWIEKKAMKTIAELATDEAAKTASVSLNDVSAGIFSCLYIVQNPQELINVNNGQELFMLLAQMELEFVKIQKPKSQMEYQSDKGGSPNV